MNGPMILFAALVIALGVSPNVNAEDTISNEKAQIQKLLEGLVVAYKARDIPRIMSAYVPDESLVVFDVAPPYKYVGAKAYTKFYEKFYADYPGPIDVIAKERNVIVRGDTAYAYEVDTWVVTPAAGQSESITAQETYVFGKIAGKWLILHEHASVPVDVSADSIK